MPSKPRTSIEKELSKWLSNAQRVILAGIGNPIRMDDFVGVKIIQNLEGKLPDNVFLIQCETVPESFIQQIIEFSPTHILLIDAAILGLRPGEARLIGPEKLTIDPAFSTHMLPLRIFCEYLSNTTEARIALLLIQPKETEFGEGLSPQVVDSSQQISEALLTILQEI